MTTKFGFLSRLEFLQDWASVLIVGINPAVEHNLEKYRALKKVHYLSAVEKVEGDYLEFGVFTGSSFCHSIRCCQKMAYLNSEAGQTRFFGFDSFSGFGTLSKIDSHPFYQDENFATNFDRINRRVGRVARGATYRLVSGFFSETLKAGPAHYGIEKSRVIFVDSDTYSSAREALAFCLPTIQQGTFIVLDDYFSYLGSEKRGVAGAFAEFVKIARIKVRHVIAYGMGGAVYIVSDKAA